MSALLSKQDIANYTGVSISSVERILWCFKQQNAISDVTAEQRCRSDRALHGEDVEVSIHTLQVGGFTMKKVQVKYSIDNIGTDLVGSSFHTLQLSIQKKSNLHTSTKSVYTQ